MEKEQNQNLKNNQTTDKENTDIDPTKNPVENKAGQTENNENNSEENNKELSLEDKITELEDKLTRSFAEMENQRRRFEKEREDAFEYGGFNFAKEALSLIDNLDRSKNILKNDDKLKETDALKKTLEHFDIIYKDLMSIFSKNNIKPIESLNKKLDPNYHQAMMEIDDDTKEPGTIIQEIQKGFTIKDRLLRPSLVGVAKKTQKETPKNEENKENSEDK